MLTDLITAMKVPLNVSKVESKVSLTDAFEKSAKFVLEFLWAREAVKTTDLAIKAQQLIHDYRAIVGPKWCLKKQMAEETAHVNELTTVASRSENESQKLRQECDCLNCYDRRRACACSASIG